MCAHVTHYAVDPETTGLVILPPRRGRFTGRYDAYPMRPPHWWSRTPWDVRLDPAAPLTWCYGELRARPDRHSVTDWGSIPMAAQTVIPALSRDRYPRSYLYHDSAYRNKAWWVETSLFEFVRQPLTREQADDWLHTMLIAEGATRATAATVYAAVRACGWAVW